MPHYMALIDEGEGTYGVVIPDCPGCTAMGNSVEDALENATEALREWTAARVADGLAPPEARSLRALRHDTSLAEDFAAGPVIASLPLLLDAGRPVRANLSIDAGLLQSIDQAAKARGLTRSSFLASAAREKIAAGR